MTLLDPATGKELHSSRPEHGCLKDVVLTPDGSAVAAATDFMARRVQFWDVGTAKERRTLAGFQFVTKFAFGPKGKALATFTPNDRCPRLWDLETGRETSPPGHREEVASLAFSPDGQTLASASVDGTLRLWDVRGGQENRCVVINQNAWGWPSAVGAGSSRRPTVRTAASVYGTLAPGRSYRLSTNLGVGNVAGFSPEGDSLVLGEYYNERNWYAYCNFPPGRSCCDCRAPNRMAIRTAFKALQR